MSFEDNIPTDSSDQELQEFLLSMKQSAQIQAQVHNFNDVCWEKCMARPSTKLDSKTELCFTNCVDRFFDVSSLIINRFAQLMNKSG